MIRPTKTKRRWFSVTAKDCEWTFKRGSGKGGQKRNKTSNAVQCSHPPSGAVGEAEDLKSQPQNRKLAFERMVATPEFQSWLNLKIEAGKGNVEIEEDGVVRKMSMEEI